MKVDPLLVAVAATGGGSIVFLAAYFIYHGFWHDLRRLDKTPTWYSMKTLLKWNVLRLKAPEEVVHDKSAAEYVVMFLCLSYISLGFVNFAAGIYSVTLFTSIRDNTCEYAYDMGNLCSQNISCSLPCGSPNFMTCGTVLCSQDRCESDLSTFMHSFPGATDATNSFDSLQGQLTVVQAAASIFGTTSSLIIQAVPSLLASFRTEKSGLSVSGYVSGFCAPIYIAFAALVFYYGFPIRQRCSSFQASTAHLCSGSISDGYFLNLCKVDPAIPLDACLITVLLSGITLSFEGLLAFIFCYLAAAFKVTYHIQHSLRKAKEEAARLSIIQAHLITTKRETEQGQWSTISLVQKDSYVKVPCLLQLYRGHEAPVLCIQAVRLEETDAQDRIFTGGADGTARMWDLETAQCLRVWRGHTIVQALCIHQVIYA